MPKFEQVYKFDYQELDALTSEMSDTAIAKKIGCAMSTVYLARKQFEIKSYREKTGNKISRKSGRVLEPGKGEYFDKAGVDRTFFKSIDSEIKAYTLGLMATDGYIMYTPKGRYFAIELQQPDSIVLHAIAQTIKGNDSCVKPCIRPGKKPSEKMIVYSRDLVEQLMELGITLKTGDRQCIKDFPASIAKHYLRGIFDGDGSIRVKNGMQIVLSVSSKDLAYGVAELANLHLGLEPKVRQSTVNNKPFYTVGFWGVHKARPLVEWVYADSTIAIPRKLKAANIWLSRF
jgi:DNA-binding transcriptional regulator WhiA